MANQYRRLQQTMKEQEKYIIIDADHADYLKETMDKRYRLDQLSQLIADAGSEEIQRQYHGYIGMRRIISVQKPPIDAYIHHNLIPFLIDHIRHNQQLHLQTLRIFTFIASGNDKQSFHLTGKPVFQFITSSLKSNVDKIGLEAIWTIANLLGDSNDNREICMNAGIVQILLKQLDLEIQANYQEKYSSIVWALSNICRGKPLQPYKKIRAIVLKMVECFNKAVMVSQDMMQEVIWSIHNYKNDPEVLSLLSEHKPIQNFIKFSQEKVINIIYPTLNIVVYILKKKKQMRSIFLQCKLLDSLSSLLLQNRVIRRFAIQVILQISEEKWPFQAIITHDCLLNNLLSHMYDNDLNMIADTCLLLSQLLQLKDHNELIYSYRQNKVIRRILKQSEKCDDGVGMFLDTLYKIMIFGFRIKPNPFLIQLKLALKDQQTQQSLNTFAELQSHISNEIFLEKLFKITSILEFSHT